MCAFYEFVVRVAILSQCMLLIQSKSIFNVFEPYSKPKGDT
jgi:hypothetical protein